jgi:glutathione S-transferase
MLATGESRMADEPAAADTASLLTFAPMVDSEACRFALNHYGVRYREEPHLFGWASMVALRRGRTMRIPLLYGGGYRLAGARKIVDLFDRRCPPERKLLPTEKRLSDQVNADWTRFNDTLGWAVAKFAYQRLLPHRELMIEPFSRGVPACEASVLRWAYWPFAAQFYVPLWLTPRRAREASAQIRSIFDETDRRLSDGRRYLAGDIFSLSDLALAASAAALLLPEGYGSPMPPPDRMPPEMVSMRAELDQRETARFVRRIYRDHRSVAG